MLILFSPSDTPMWVLYKNSCISKKHGVAFKALVPLTSVLHLQVEILNSHTNVIALCLTAGVESNH